MNKDINAKSVNITSYLYILSFKSYEKFLIPAIVFHGIFVASQSFHLHIIWHQQKCENLTSQKIVFAEKRFERTSVRRNEV